MPKLGLAAFDDQKAKKQQYESVGDDLACIQLAEVEAQVTQMQNLLQTYARKHVKEIKESSSLRTEFARLCARLGVDTLGVANTKKNTEYYDALAVQIIEICRATREDNGGILPVCDAIALISGKPRENDIVNAMSRLDAFGPGITLDHLPNGTLILRSHSHELNNDHASALAACDALQYITTELLVSNLSWTASRADAVIESMVACGLLWVDNQTNPIEYWSPQGFASLHT